MKYCSKCGTALEDDMTACPNCGAEQGEVRTKYCSKCGAAVDIDAVVCPKCGCKLAEKESSAWGILSLIFGLLGGWLGLVLGIMGLKRCQKKSTRVMCILGIVFFVGWVAAYIAIMATGNNIA